MSYYGIDLGTTNSLIGNDALGYLSDLVPSCVNMKTHNAGREEYTNPEAARSFKIDMSLGVEGALPRQASADVLKALKAQTAGMAKDVIISVPAYFSDSQRQATMEAAKIAGLTVHGLVNEPTAAAMYIAKDKKSLFVVMDLGGGTFDVSIIDSRFGMYDVQATDGRVIGGDNLDNNILKYLVKNAKIPFHHLDKNAKNALRIKCASYKREMTEHYGEDRYIDLSDFGSTSKFKFTVKDYKQLMQMTFAETISLTKKLVEQYLPYGEVYEVLLVGGSTKDPYYKEWVENELGMEVADLTYDPDRVVAQGAALYARLVEEGKINVSVSDVTKALGIGLADGTCDILVDQNSKIPLKVETMVVNDIESDVIHLELYQGDNILCRDNELIGELIWNYGRTVEPGKGFVYIEVEIDSAGIIYFTCRESLGNSKTVVLDRKKV